MKKEFDNEQDLVDYLGRVLPIDVRQQNSFDGEAVLTKADKRLIAERFGTTFYPAVDYSLSIVASWQLEEPYVAFLKTCILAKITNLPDVIIDDLFACMGELK